MICIFYKRVFVQSQLKSNKKYIYKTISKHKAKTDFSFKALQFIFYIIINIVHFAIIHCVCLTEIYICICTYIYMYIWHIRYIYLFIIILYKILTFRFLAFAHYHDVSDVNLFFFCNILFILLLTLTFCSTFDIHLNYLTRATIDSFKQSAFDSI